MSDLRAILTAHYQEHGELQPRRLWQEAQPKTAPLHHYFEWNNKIAGDKYRDLQASRLIRSAEVEYAPLDQPDERHKLRAFWAVRHTVAPDGAGYRPVEECVEDPITLQILLRECERAAADFKRKYGHLKEFAEIVRRRLGDGDAA